MLRTLTLLIGLTFSCGLSAQSLQLAWYNRLSKFEVKAAQLDPFGDVVLAGTFEGQVDFDFGPGKAEFTASGLHDAFVAKYDAYGNFLWVATLGNQNPEEVRAIDIDQNGNIFAAGEFTGVQDFDPGPGQHMLSVSGYVDVFVWVLDPNGSLIRAHAMGGNSYETANSISVQKDGYVALGGFFWGNPDMDHDPNVTKQIFSQGQTDGFVLKMAPNGGVQWVRSYGTSGHERVNSVHIDANHKVSLTGSAGGNTDFDPHPILQRFMPGNSGGGYLLELDSVGDIDTLISLGLVPQQMLVSPRGYFFSGHFSGSFDFNPDTTSSYTLNAVGSAVPLYAWHLDSLLNFVYARMWPGANLMDHHMSLSQGADQGLVIAANFNDTIDLDPTAFQDLRWTQGLNDMFAVHLDSLGDYSYGNAWGSGLGDKTAYALMNQSGELYLGGLFSARMDFDPAPSIFDEATPLGTEGFMLKLTYCQEVVGHDTIEACNQYTWINKYTYTDTRSGDRYIIPSPKGCDSLVYLHLTIHYLPNGITRQDSLFTAQAPQALYQWIDCDKDSIIPGAISRNFIPDTFGNYAVIVSNPNCIDTSACLYYGSDLNLEEPDPLAEIAVYPNPSHNGQVYLDLDPEVQEFRWQVFDLQGKLWQDRRLQNSGEHQFQLPAQKGLYLIRITHGKEVRHFKLQRL